MKEKQKQTKAHQMAIIKSVSVIQQSISAIAKNKLNDGETGPFVQRCSTLTYIYIWHIVFKMNKMKIRKPVYLFDILTHILSFA